MRITFSLQPLAGTRAVLSGIGNASLFVILVAEQGVLKSIATTDDAPPLPAIS
jgi:hypothetical protein